MQHGVGRAFQKIGKADIEFGLAQADGVIDGNERIEADVHRRRGRTGAKLGVGFAKNFGQAWGHVEVRLARETVPSNQYPVPSIQWLRPSASERANAGAFSCSRLPVQCHHLDETLNTTCTSFEISP